MSPYWIQDMDIDIPPDHDESSKPGPEYDDVTTCFFTFMSQFNAHTLSYRPADGAGKNDKDGV